MSSVPMADEATSDLRRARSEPARPLSLRLMAVLAVATLAATQASDLPQMLADLRLPDTDDAMRLVRVRDLLAGQGWFDGSQHRLLSPEGGALHWSRLVDVPIAGLILLLKPILGVDGAERATVMLWPWLLFAGFISILGFGVRHWFGARAAAFAMLAPLVFGQMRFEFTAGRIDHHSVQLILTLVTILSCLGLGRSGRVAALGGLAAGLSLAVGLEMLPALALAGAVHAFLWVRDGDEARRGLASFASAMALVAGASFLAQTGPSAWAAPACDALSLPWLLLAGGAAAACLAATAVAGGTPRARILALGIAVTPVVALFAFAYPTCLTGPYGTIPEIVRTQWLERVTEAMSAIVAMADRPEAVLANLGPAVTAALFATFAARAVSGESRDRFAILALFLWIGPLLALHQIRAISIGGAALPILAGVVIARALERVRDREGGTPLPPSAILSLAAVPFLFAPVWALGTAALRPILTGHPSPPAPVPVVDLCAKPADIAALATLPAGTILADIDPGPSILQRTGHSVIAAPYHRNVQGIADSLRAFSGDETTVREIAVRYRADYILVCQAPGADDPSRTAFVADLLRGATVPWLDAHPREFGNLKVYRVDRDALGRP